MTVGEKGKVAGKIVCESKFGLNSRALKLKESSQNQQHQPGAPTGGSISGPHPRPAQSASPTDKIPR